MPQAGELYFARSGETGPRYGSRGLDGLSITQIVELNKHTEDMSRRLNEKTQRVVRFTW